MTVVNPPYLEAARYVGQAGQPAFAGDWANFAGGYQSLLFYKDGSGLVHVEGQITTPGGQASLAAIFTLPVGYRPTLDVPIVAPGQTLGFAAPAYVRATGVVTIAVATGAGAVVGIAGHFRPV